MKKLRFTLFIMGLLLCVGFMSSCGDDDDDDKGGAIPSGFCGCYYFDDISGGYSKDQYYTFYENGTGEYRKEGKINTFIATFSYTFKGSTIKCKGVHSSINSDGEVDIDKNWSKTIEYIGSSYIKVDGNTYKKIS